MSSGPFRLPPVGRSPARNLNEISRPSKFSGQAPLDMTIKKEALRASFLCQPQFLLPIHFNLLVSAVNCGEFPLHAAYGTVAEPARPGLPKNTAPLHAARERVQKGITLLAFFFAYFDCHDFMRLRPELREQRTPLPVPRLSSSFLSRSSRP